MHGASLSSQFFSLISLEVPQTAITAGENLVVSKDGTSLDLIVKMPTAVKCLSISKVYNLAIKIHFRLELDI